jgi:N-hydroxyarylamine O-acetyltransferase
VNERPTPTFVRRYLHRVAFAGPVAPTAEALRSLQLAHLYAVPFENLDIHLGRPIVTSIEPILRKVVESRRGGFCYELNGAFAALLEAVGFEVQRLAAGVARAEGGFGPAFDHLALMVSVPGDGSVWLADVGFGDGFLEPLPFAVGEEREQANGAYRLDRHGEDVVLRRRASAGGPFESQYRFALQAHQLAEFEGMCRYHQTSPDSHFTRQRVCSRATPEGRITLTETDLITTSHGVRTEEPVEDDAAYRTTLRERFGIDVVDPWIHPTATTP